MENKVAPKKHLGQHFLTEEETARKIVEALTWGKYKNLIEVGPGMGVLSKYLFKLEDKRVVLLDIDQESIDYLKKAFPDQVDSIRYGDFLAFKPNDLFGEDSYAVIGNFPYNISTQIVFKILENRSRVPEMVGMFQREVAQRIASKSGNKVYGILSVLVQAFYSVEYLFTVDEDQFFPPPKVKSAVIRFQRNDTEKLGCDEKLFFSVVKMAFNQRRKTLRNALSGYINKEFTFPYMDKRAEQLDVIHFVEITNFIADKIAQSIPE